MTDISQSTIEDIKLGIAEQFQVAQKVGASSAIRFIGSSESRKYRGRLVLPSRHALRSNTGRSDASRKIFDLLKLNSSATST